MNMDIELANSGVIQEGIPAKKKGGGGGRKVKYPFGEVGVGQMFTYECSPDDKIKTMHRLSAAANAWCHRQGMTVNYFVVRTLPQGIGVYRIGGDDKPLEG